MKKHSPSYGQRSESAKSGSKVAVSLSSDSGY
jgi:hypothetical protein